MSFIPDLFGGAPKVKSEPMPTRDTAADSAEDERRRKIGSGYGAGTLLLSGPGGVTGELTGTRSAGG